jgi:hypothetical protein
MVTPGSRVRRCVCRLQPLAPRCGPASPAGCVRRCGQGLRSYADADVARAEEEVSSLAGGKSIFAGNDRRAILKEC